MYFSTITGFVNNGFKILWWDGGCDKKVVLPLSDVVSKVVNTLKMYYPNTIYITCVILMQQRVTEEVRGIYFEINVLVKTFKKVFLKACCKKNIKKYYLIYN